MIVKLRKPYTTVLEASHGKEAVMLELEIPAERTLLVSEKVGGSYTVQFPIKGQGADAMLRLAVPEKLVEVVSK